MEGKHQKRWFWVGLTGSVTTAVCCFTPILVLLLGAAGLGAVTGYLDYVLLPGLVVFLAMLVYGLSRKRQVTGRPCCAERPGTPPVSDGTGGNGQSSP